MPPKPKKVVPKRAPFNTSTKRFGRNSGHPKLDPSGLYLSRPDGCDPCLYHPIRIGDLCGLIHNKTLDKDPWRYKSELEAWAQNLGYRNQKVLERRRWDRSILGPAWHDVAEPTTYLPACMNVGFGRTSRSKRTKDFVPGPGTYTRTKPFKAPYGPHSLRQTFDREEPCRFKDTAPVWSLAPNRYKIRDRESIAEKSNKLVSLRGPYDLFTGKRTDHVRNHFSQSLKVSCATWPIAIPGGSLDTYKKSRLGMMNKTGRDKPYRGRNALVDISMCYRKPSDPGPAHYNLRGPSIMVFKQNMWGFNSSYDKPVGYQKAIVWPAVGRYTVKNTQSILGMGHKHVFKCKVPRTIGSYLPEPMNSF